MSNVSSVKAGFFYRISAAVFPCNPRALMCLGVWSRLGFVTDSDVKAAIIVLLELHEDDEEGELDIKWDKIS